MATFNNPTYKYITADVIINQVKNMLSSYFNQGTLDESIMYPKIRSCLDTLGLKVHPMKSEIIHINDRQGRLPLDFYKLANAIGYGEFEAWEDMEGLNGLTPTITEKRVYEIPVCKSRLDYCTDECGETYEIIQSFEQLKYRYYDKFNIRVVSSDLYCDNACTNKTCSSDNEVSIRNGFLYANFNGSIYIDYLATMETLDGDLLIPDYSQITDWITEALIVECLRKLFLNGEGSVETRLREAKAELTVKQARAENFRRMAEVQDLYDVRKILMARYNKYQSAVRGINYANRQYI